VPTDSQAWLEELSRLRASGTPCAVVVVTGVKGSAPREVGARMVVAAGRLAWGSIGGGRLEHVAIDHATELLGAGHISESVAYPLSEKVGQCCGGEVTLFFETFPWTRRKVVIFGAGHVGQALGKLAPWLDADVSLVDARDPDELDPALPVDPPFELVTTNAPEAELESLASDAYVVIMTHDHALDLELVAAGLQRGGFAFLGLIGSARKWARFQKRLALRGFGPEALARVTCPIGLSKVSKEPRAIALTVAAQLSQLLDTVTAPRAGVLE